MKAIGAKNLPKLRAFMDEKGIDCILLSSHNFVQDVNIRYFSGFFQEKGNFSCSLLITKEKRILFTHPFDFERACMADVEEVINIKDFGFSYSKAIGEKIKKFEKIGICKSKISVEAYEKLKKISRKKFFDVENFLLDLRSIKLKEEIELIEKAARITNYGIKVAEEVLVEKRKKVSEEKLAEILREAIKEKGAEDLAFLTIVASQKRTSFPHPFPSASKQIIKNFGFVDFGSVYKGYCTDVTIPFLIGSASTEKRKIIKIVLDAYNFAISTLHQGMPTWKLHDEVNNFLSKANLRLSHGLGHGIGLEIHEKPSISEKPKELRGWKEERFEQNMVFTIEPAVYLKNFGCRIENDFLLKGKKIKILTNSNLIEV
jgi:Xaa-Pro aminopeptidase